MNYGQKPARHLRAQGSKRGESKHRTIASFAAVLLAGCSLTSIAHAQAVNGEKTQQLAQAQLQLADAEARVRAAQADLAHAQSELSQMQSAGAEAPGDVHA